MQIPGVRFQISYMKCKNVKLLIRIRTLQAIWKIRTVWWKLLFICIWTKFRISCDFFENYRCLNSTCSLCALKVSRYYLFWIERYKLLQKYLRKNDGFIKIVILYHFLCGSKNSAINAIFVKLPDVPLQDVCREM